MEFCQSEKVGTLQECSPEAILRSWFKELLPLHKNCTRQAGIGSAAGFVNHAVIRDVVSTGPLAHGHLI